MAGIWEYLLISDFSLGVHRTIYRRMKQIHERDEPIDRVTLAHELGDHNELNGIGGLTYLCSLDEGMPHPAHVMRYATIVREAGRLRSTILSAHMFAQQLADPTTEHGGLRQMLNRLVDHFEQQGEDGVDLMDQVQPVDDFEISTQDLVEDLVEEGSVTLLCGSYGDGKSTLAMAVGAAIASGQRFLGRTTVKRPVLILDRENGLATVKDRMFRLGIADSQCSLRIWGFWGDRRKRQPPGPDAIEILRFVRCHKPVLIFDSLIAFAGCDENDAAQMRAHLSWYRRLAAAGATVVILHHASEKADGAAHKYRGSTDIPGAVDSAWLLSRDDGSTPNDPLGRLVLTPFKTRISPSKPIRIEFRNSTFVPVDGPLRSPLEFLLERVKAYPGSMQKELIAAGVKEGYGERKLVDTLNGAILRGEILARRGKRKTFCHYLPEAALAVSA
jgi:hypothetical protein